MPILRVPLSRLSGARRIFDRYRTARRLFGRARAAARWAFESARQRGFELGQAIKGRQRAILDRYHDARTAISLANTQWRVFLHPPYRPYANLALGQGLVSALSGVSLVIPLLLIMGLNVGLISLIGVVVLIGPAAQLAVPSLLRRGDGNLRALTLGAATLGETRGLWLAGAAAAVGIGLASPAFLVAAAIASMAVTGVCSGVAAANGQAWLAAVLPEPERRFVGPRLAGLSAAIGAAALAPVAILLALAGANTGPGVFALPFLIGGLAGLFELRAMRTLPHPGRVTVPRLRHASLADPGRMRNFLVFATLAAAGSGLAPYFSAYAIVVLHASSAAAVAIGAATAATSVLTATVVAATLSGRSASRFLRASYGLLGAAWLALPLAHPANYLSFAWLLTVALVVTVAATMAGLATTERLFRLATGPGAIAHQGQFVGLTAVSTGAGQLVAAAVMGLGPVGYPSFIFLALASGSARLVAALRLQVSSNWATTTGVWRAGELAEQKSGSSS